MKLKMKTSLSGPEFTLSPGDVHAFDDDEAQRLIVAGYGEEFVEESDEDALDRLEQEVATLRKKLGKDKKDGDDGAVATVEPPVVPPVSEPAVPPPGAKPAAAKPAKPAKA